MLYIQGSFRTAILLLFICSLPPGTAHGFETSRPPFPFSPGEKLYYEVYWLGIKAAEASLEIQPMDAIDGKTVWHFTMIAQTSPLVAALYPVQNRIDSWTDTDMIHALKYTEKKRKRFGTKHVSITFDWETNTAHSVKNEKKRTVALEPGAFDPLSIFYFFRMQDLRENHTLAGVVADRKRCVKAVAHVRGKQTLRIGEQVWETWLVEPDLSQVKHVFEKNPKARLQIWVSADERRIPVMLKSKIAVGSFAAHLVKIESPPAAVPAQSAAAEDNQTR